MWKNKKGVSLTVMVITVLVIFIVLSTLTYSVSTSAKTRKLNKLYDDIRQLNDAISVYYLKNGSLPVDANQSSYKVLVGTRPADDMKCVLKKDVDRVVGKESFFNPNDFQKYLTNTDDGAEYKSIKTNLLENVTLNYKDGYIINLKSHTIYYKNGIKIDGVWYYTLPINYTDVGTSQSDIVSSISLISGGDTLYFPLRGSGYYLSDKIKFYDEEGLEVIKPKSVTYELGDRNDYIQIDENTGLIQSINSDAYEGIPETSVIVTVRNYGSDIPVIETFNIIPTNVQVVDKEGSVLTDIELKAYDLIPEYSFNVINANGGGIDLLNENENIAVASYNRRLNILRIEPKGPLGSTKVTLKELEGNAYCVLNVNITGFGERIASSNEIEDADYTMTTTNTFEPGVNTINSTISITDATASDYPILVYYYLTDTTEKDPTPLGCGEERLREGETTSQFVYKDLTIGKKYEVITVAMNQEGKRAKNTEYITIQSDRVIK